MDYLPVMLNVSHRRAIIIGGGDAAYKKVRNLLNHGVKVTVIASEFDSRITPLNVDKIRMGIHDPVEVSKYLEENNIVIIATDNSELNRSLEVMCVEKNFLYNRVDEASSPFIFPASFETDGVIISVSTVGRTPSLTRFIRDQLKERVKDLTPSLPVVERLRNDCTIPDLKQKAYFFSELFKLPEFWILIRQEKTEEAYELGLKLSAEFEAPHKQS